MSDLTGQIGIVTNAARWSMGWWVEKVTRSPAHHVVVCIGNGAGSPVEPGGVTYCVSAEPGGVRYRMISEYGNRITWTQYELTPFERSQIAWHADGHIGIDYNVRAFVALGIQYLTGLNTPAWIVRHLTGRARVTCSQLSADILRATNIHPIPTAPLVTPKHWYDLATQQGWT